jgi:hypothetical protein
MRGCRVEECISVFGEINSRGRVHASGLEWDF